MTNVIRSAAVIALMAMGAVAAQAQQPTSAEAGSAPEIANSKDSQTRQEVKNDYVQARKDGKLQMNGDAYKPKNDIRSSSKKSRADVKKEAAAANKKGNMQAKEGSRQ